MMPDFRDSDLNAAAPYLNAAIARYGLDPALIYAQCDQESRFKADAFLFDRNGGSYGLMQMSYPTAAGLGYQGTAEQLYDPSINADLGCHLMAQLLTRYGGNPATALAAYNAGPGNLAAGAAYASAVLQKADWFTALFAAQQPVPIADDGGTLLDNVPAGEPTVVSPLAIVATFALLGGLAWWALK